ncbi:gata transcription factor [Moniliophthora roreri]|nr:gata transcription factor [Moniliophthora roreri]
MPVPYVDSDFPSHPPIMRHPSLELPTSLTSITGRYHPYTSHPGRNMGLSSDRHASQSYYNQAETYSPRPLPFLAYTDDAAIKMTDRVRRKCSNCSAVDTTTWRRSSINIGKVVCNKCGLFERTHGRPRPHMLPNRRDSLMSRYRTSSPSTIDQAVSAQNMAYPHPFPATPSPQMYHQSLPPILPRSERSPSLPQAREHSTPSSSRSCSLSEAYADPHNERHERRFSEGQMPPQISERELILGSPR